MKLYVFDLDGTVTDSNGLWVEVDHRFLGRRGLTPTQEYLETVGRSIFPVAADYTKAYYGLEDDPAAIMAEWEALAAHQYTHEVELKPGVRAFLEQCRREGIPMAVFTACRRNLCTAALDRFGLTDWFAHVVYADEIGLEKHHPACFARLSELLGVPPEDCVFFDDSPSNCATAKAAGFHTVGVYDRFYHHRQEDLKAACHRYILSFEELLK